MCLMCWGKCAFMSGRSFSHIFAPLHALPLGFMDAELSHRTCLAVGVSLGLQSHDFMSPHRECGCMCVCVLVAMEHVMDRQRPSV